MKMIAKFLTLSSLCAFSFVQSASATSYSYTFGGVITSVDPTIVDTFFVGDSFSGSFSFDDAILPRSGSDWTFSVFDALTAYNVTVGTYSASFSNPAGLSNPAGVPEIQEDNDPGMGFHDRFLALARAGDGLTGLPYNGQKLDSSFVRFDDSSDAVFSDAMMLPTMMSISDFDSTLFFLTFSGEAGPMSVVGEISSLRLVDSSVPEPTSLMLFSFGVAGLVARRRNRNACAQL